MAVLYEKQMPISVELVVAFRHTGVRLCCCSFVLSESGSSISPVLVSCHGFRGIVPGFRRICYRDYYDAGNSVITKGEENIKWLKRESLATLGSVIMPRS